MQRGARTGSQETRRFWQGAASPAWGLRLPKGACKESQQFEKDRQADRLAGLLRARPWRSVRSAPVVSSGFGVSVPLASGARSSFGAGLSWASEDVATTRCQACPVLPHHLHQLGPPEVPARCQMSPWGKDYPQLRTTRLKYSMHSWYKIYRNVESKIK